MQNLWLTSIMDLWGPILQFWRGWLETCTCNLTGRSSHNHPYVLSPCRSLDWLLSLFMSPSKHLSWNLAVLNDLYNPYDLPNMDFSDPDMDTQQLSLLCRGCLQNLYPRLLVLCISQTVSLLIFVHTILCIFPWISINP